MGPDHGIRPENLFSAKQNLGNRTTPLQVLQRKRDFEKQLPSLRVLPWQARRARCFAVHMSKTHKLRSFKKHVFGTDLVFFYNSSAFLICGIFIMFPNWFDKTHETSASKRWNFVNLTLFPSKVSKSRLKPRKWISFWNQSSLITTLNERWSAVPMNAWQFGLLMVFLVETNKNDPLLEVFIQARLWDRHTWKCSMTRCVHLWNLAWKSRLGWQLVSNEANLSCYSLGDDLVASSICRNTDVA